MGNGISQPSRVEPPVGSTWQFYKIADEPLDIVGKEIEIFVEGINTPIIGSNWKSNNPDSGEGYILNAYTESVGSASILVLNEATYADNADTNGTYPLSGIFVSNDVRRIRIGDKEVVHKIDAKYIPTSKHILANIDGDNSGEQMIGAGYVSANGGSQFVMNLIFTNKMQILSPQDIGADDIMLGVDDVQIKRVGSTISDTDSDLHSYIDWDSGNNFFNIYLPETSVLDTFCITYKELIADEGGYPVYKNSSFILYVNSLVFG